MQMSQLTLLLEQLTTFFHGEAEGEDCIKIHTPFLFPDGDYITVYLVLTDSSTYLTDKGETLGWLADQGIPLEQARAMFPLPGQAAQEVELDQGEIRVLFDDWGEGAWALVRLTQTIIELSSLAYREGYDEDRFH